MSISPREFIVPNEGKVSSAAQARELAIAYQQWYGEHSISYGETVYYQNYFEALAVKFPELTDEFKENDII